MHDRRYFFVHIMKTGGTSFAGMVRANFPQESCYPDLVLAPESDLLQRMEAYTYTPALVAAVNDAPDIRVVRGHVPYAVKSLLHAEFQVLTILRDPVERTLSYLKHCRKYHHEHNGLSPEDIYNQPWFYESFIHNYQTKIFSMTASEALEETRVDDISPPLPPRTAFMAGEAPPPEVAQRFHDTPARLALEMFSPSTGVVIADSSRLELAKANLRQVDLVGTNEGYNAFLDQLRERYGWKIEHVPRKNVGETLDVSAGFRARIEKDNALDMELYELAKSLSR